MLVAWVGGTVPVVFCLALFLELRKTTFLGLLFRRKNFNASLGDGKSFTVSSCCGNAESVVVWMDGMDGIDGAVFSLSSCCGNAESLVGIDEASTTTATATARVAAELEEERTSERRRSGGVADTGVVLVLVVVVVVEGVCKSCSTVSY